MWKSDFLGKNSLFHTGCQFSDENNYRGLECSDFLHKITSLSLTLFQCFFYVFHFFCPPIFLSKLFCGYLCNSLCVSLAERVVSNLCFFHHPFALLTRGSRRAGQRRAFFNREIREIREKTRKERMCGRNIMGRKIERIKKTQEQGL